MLVLVSYSMSDRLNKVRLLPLELLLDIEVLLPKELSLLVNWLHLFLLFLIGVIHLLFHGHLHHLRSRRRSLLEDLLGVGGRAPLAVLALSLLLAALLLLFLLFFRPTIRFDLPLDLPEDLLLLADHAAAI